jgi:DNA-binding NarL/FixJ family response regulator
VPGADNGSVSATPAERETTAREAARRQAVTMLQISASTCTYAAAQLGDGIGPAEARQTALFVAGELAVMAAALRRLALARLDPAERRRLVAELAASGMSQKQVAEQLGVAKRTVWGDLRARR